MDSATVAEGHSLKDNAGVMPSILIFYVEEESGEIEVALRSLFMELAAVPAARDRCPLKLNADAPFEVRQVRVTVQALLPHSWSMSCVATRTLGFGHC